MSLSLRWYVLLGCTTVLIAVVMQLPQFAHRINPQYQGIAVHLNSDEEVYLARVEEALNGRPEQAAEAFIGDPSLKGSQPAPIEAAIGTLFRFTGWRAATVLQVMDSVAPPLLFLAIWVFLCLAGFTKKQAFVGAVAFVLIELYGLNRPIHQSVSFLLVMAAIDGVLLGLKRWWWAGVLGGIILGFLVGAYFWSWSFGWLFAGILFLWELLESRVRHSHASRNHWKRLFLFLCIGVIVAAPSVWQMVQLSHDPLYHFAAFRSGMRPSHVPESIPYSVIFILMTFGVLVTLWRRYDAMRRHRAAVVMVLTGFIAIHQEVIHGIVFNFVSHYLFGLVLAALCAVLVAWSVRSKWLLLGAAAACVYLAAVAWDGRWVLKQYTMRPGDFAEQHLASALPVLDQLPRSRILSDAATSAFIAGATKQDIVYSIYLKNVLMTHEEIAERYCLTVLPLPPAERHIPDQPYLVYPDADGAFKNDPSVRAKEVTMVEQACTRIDQNPRSYLKKYGVQEVLWDEQRQPTWDLKRLGVTLTKNTAGQGWSLWSVN